MRLSYLILAILTFGSVRSEATDILWLSFKSTFSYRDLSTVCSNKDFPHTLYFGAEVEGLEIKKAVLRDSLASSASILALSSEEIKGLTVHQDAEGQLWLRNISMSGRLLTWMFFEAGAGGFSSCKPPQALATIDPTSFLFEFDVEKAATEAESNLGKFRGTLKDGTAYQAQLLFSERPYQYDAKDFSESSFGYTYPNPPWTKSVSVSGNSSNKFSAQGLCRSDASSKGRRLENTCRSNGGVASTSHPSCILCNQLGSQWRCNDTVRVRCSAQRSIDRGTERVFEIPFVSDENADNLLDSNLSASPVFSDRQDCRAIAMNNAGICRNRDCKGVLFSAQSYCQSGDCKAIVRGIASYCQTRDCRAVVYNNIGFCESANCRAVLYKNFGMCR